LLLIANAPLPGGGGGELKPVEIEMPPLDMGVAARSRLAVREQVHGVLTRRCVTWFAKGPVLTVHEPLSRRRHGCWRSHDRGGGWLGELVHGVLAARREEAGPRLARSAQRRRAAELVHGVLAARR